MAEMPDAGPANLPICASCALDGGWFWVCWPGQASDLFDLRTPPLASGYAGEKREVRQAILHVVREARGELRWLRARPGIAQAYHRRLLAERDSAGAFDRVEDYPARPPLKVVEADGTLRRPAIAEQWESGLREAEAEGPC